MNFAEDVPEPTARCVRGVTLVGGGGTYATQLGLLVGVPTPVSPAVPTQDLQVASGQSRRTTLTSPYLVSKEWVSTFGIQEPYSFVVSQPEVLKAFVQATRLTRTKRHSEPWTGRTKVGYAKRMWVSPLWRPTRRFQSFSPSAWMRIT